MSRSLTVFVFGLLVLVVVGKVTIYSDQWAVHVHGGPQAADRVALQHGFVNLGQIFPDYYHFAHRKVSKRSTRTSDEHHQKLIQDPQVRWAKQQEVKSRVKRDFRQFKELNPNVALNDPRWPQMWYLNRGGGLDMNVEKAWAKGVTGKGVVVTILDDGLEKDHPDIRKNYDSRASVDVNNHDDDPQPRYDLIDSNRHGTRCAGEVAADANNSICAVGVAYGASVGGVRMLDGEVTDAVEARSLSLNPVHIDIYSASWGPDDDGKTVDGPGELATRAFMEGVKNGRNGLGSIFVWASGNGGREYDNCNCDGYTNSIWTLSISSATENGKIPWYSEACSSTLATTYSSGSSTEKQVVTTDLHHGCTSTHTGTSASAPLAAGICALALQVNRRLTWRDMQHIVVRSARPANLHSSDWAVNGVGRNVSHSFGYGLMDAYAMVELAKNWTTVPEQKVCTIVSPHRDKLIPANSEVTLSVFVNCPHVRFLEHVQAKISLMTLRRGEIRIYLVSPMKTRSTLLAMRPHDNARNGFQAWPFMTVHSWGENPAGNWTLEIHNEGRYQGRTVILQEWELTLYGTAEDPDNHKPPSPASVFRTSTSSLLPSFPLSTTSTSTSTTRSSTTPVPLPPPGIASDDVFDNSVLHSGLQIDHSSKQSLQNGAATLSEWSLIMYGTKEDPEDHRRKGNQPVSSSSSCLRMATTSGSCLECKAGYSLVGTTCKPLCPERTFLKADVLPHSSLKNCCVPCHYSCHSCSGSNDYECSTCYPDSFLEDGYCHSHDIHEQLVSFRRWKLETMFVIVVLFVVILALVVVIVCLKQKMKSMPNAKFTLHKAKMSRGKQYSIARLEDDSTVPIYYDAEDAEDT